MKAAKTRDVDQLLLLRSFLETGSCRFALLFAHPADNSPGKLARRCEFLERLHRSYLEAFDRRRRFGGDHPGVDGLVRIRVRPEPEQALAKVARRRRIADDPGELAAAVRGEPRPYLLDKLPTSPPSLRRGASPNRW
jgi:hypothetical protein